MLQNNNINMINTGSGAAYGAPKLVEAVRVRQRDRIPTRTATQLVDELVELSKVGSLGLRQCARSKQSYHKCGQKWRKCREPWSLRKIHLRGVVPQMVQKRVGEQSAGHRDNHAASRGARRLWQSW